MTKVLKNQETTETTGTTKKTVYSKFIGDDDVKVMLELIHTLPFSLKKQRTKNTEINKEFGSIKVNVKSGNVINVFDFKILLSIFKFFNDNSQKIVVTDIPLNDGKSKQILTIYNIDLLSFIKNYTNIKVKNKNDAIDSIKRLLNYVIYKESYNEKTKKNILTPIRFLYDFEIVNSNVASFSILRKVYQRIMDGLTLKLDTLFKIRGNVASALYIFLMGQNHTAFREITLFEMLGLNTDDKKHSRAYLKEAFAELKSIGFLDYDDLIYEKNGEKYYKFNYLKTEIEQTAEPEAEPEY